MLRHIISIIIQHSVYSNVQVLTLLAQLKTLWHLLKNISIFVVLFSKLNKNRTEIMCQNLFTGRIVKNQ